MSLRIETVHALAVVDAIRARGLHDARGQIPVAEELMTLLTLLTEELARLNARVHHLERTAR
ncbi:MULTISPECIES: hypothetical protein [unclassified Streptomyces]|uniref:hypothetical protein n=1 Tax=unclassified Streptomyces TaxID=2593676 RepID=UPI0033F56ADA